MKISLNGQVVNILPEFKKGNFRKREVVIEQLGSKYKIEFLFDSADWVNNIKHGDIINCSCNITTKESGGTYFTSIIGNTLKRYSATESYNNNNSVEQNSANYQRNENPTPKDFDDRPNPVYSDSVTHSQFSEEDTSFDDGDDDLPF